ncbi:hypothetical protein E3N88_21047 [Mikania micrantha]|uniref:Uncharacterized protein n=1 Tax=Mikania micrantha TaxID=192012 RepID=A0A5N6NJ82_9ASTR|nr:hypothetical protein E3N88_21047 [Mikania micrantha]
MFISKGKETDLVKMSNELKNLLRINDSGRGEKGRTIHIGHLEQSNIRVHFTSFLPTFSADHLTGPSNHAGVYCPLFQHITTQVVFSLYHTGLLPNHASSNHAGLSTHLGLYAIFSTAPVYRCCCSSASAATNLITWIEPSMAFIPIEDQIFLDLITIETEK